MYRLRERRRWEDRRYADVVLSAASAAGVEVHLLTRARLEDYCVEEMAENLGLPTSRWEPSPVMNGFARAGYVLWDERSLVGDNEICPHWIALLHEVSHAATGRSDGKIGSEVDATSWEWPIIARVWGCTSLEAREMRHWAKSTDLIDIRTGMKPDEAVLVAASAEWEREG